MVDYKIIAAVDLNYGIGVNGGLLIKNKEDMQFFKNTTYGSIVIMGRKTFDSMGGKPLAGRFNIVVTSKPNSEVTQVNNLTFAKSIDEALDDAKIIQSISQYKSVFVIGGGEIYKQTLDNASDIVLSVFNDDLKADTYFPSFDESKYNQNVQNYKDFKVVHYIKK